MKGIIDRFEGDYVVVEVEFERKTVNIPQKQVAPEAREGDVIVLVDNMYQVDLAETQKRKSEIAKLTEELWG